MKENGGFKLPWGKFHQPFSHFLVEDTENVEYDVSKNSDDSVFHLRLNFSQTCTHNLISFIIDSPEIVWRENPLAHLFLRRSADRHNQSLYQRRVHQQF